MTGFEYLALAFALAFTFTAGVLVRDERANGFIVACYLLLAAYNLVQVLT